MSPVNQITNPLAEETESSTAGIVWTTFVNGTTSNLKFGMLVSTSAYSGTGTRKVVPIPEAGSFAGVGVVAGGIAFGDTTIPEGTPVMVIVEGPAQVLSAGTITALTDVIIIDTASKGIGKPSSSVTVGKTYGHYTQTKDVTSGTALVWAYIHKM